MPHCAALSPYLATANTAYPSIYKDVRVCRKDALPFPARITTQAPCAVCNLNSYTDNTLRCAWVLRLVHVCPDTLADYWGNPLIIEVQLILNDFLTIKKVCVPAKRQTQSSACALLQLVLCTYTNVHAAKQACREVRRRACVTCMMRSE